MIWHYLRTSWERLLFGIVGVVLLGFTFRSLLAGQLAATSAVFAMSVFAFFYSNLARFKKFKGLGFEAELWEDKQKEAASLIDRLKSVVSIYSREVVMNSVLRGRMGGADSWQKRWRLFNDLQGRHSELGQDIDFTELRNDVDAAFLFDMCSPLENSVARSIDSAKGQLHAMAQDRFGNPIKDVEGFNEFYRQVDSLPKLQGSLFERAKIQNIARETSDTLQRFRAALKEKFNIDLTITPGVVDRLGAIAEVAERRPLVVTPELISWADDRNAFASLSS